MLLTPSQRAAIAHIEQYALQRQSRAREIIKEVCAMSAVAQPVLANAVRHIQTHARVALHFHPDRLNEQGQTVAAALLESGLYKNQFETKLSNGKLAPFLGGPRDLWEDSMFGGVFSDRNSKLAERPKYGALDLLRHPDGPAPRFGSCYLVLKAAVSQRATFSYMDSHRSPAERGSLRVFDDILAGLLLEAFERQYALGEQAIMPDALLARITDSLATPYADINHLAPARNLNHYIEAQVHGPVRLKEDVALLVADPSFQHTPIGEQLERLCATYDVQLRWHAGFRLAVAEVPHNFRGPAMLSLAEKIGEGGFIDAHILGKAAADLKKDPAGWKSRGSYEACLQELKLLWHVLLWCGRQVEE